jgi:hypothetical protein
MSRSRVGRCKKRFQARATGGRFARNTMRNTFELHVDVCALCRGINPRQLGEQRAELCSHCGEQLRDIAETKAER